jgi:hypothetical protein
MAHDALNAASVSPRASGDTFPYLEVFSVVLFLVVATLYLTSISWTDALPRDYMRLVLGRDFLNFWMYGRAALDPDPGRFYDVGIYNVALRAIAGADYPGQTWSYPPSVMLLAFPFGQLAYLQALAVWTFANAAFFLWVAGRALADFRTLAVLIFSPATILCLISGQSSFLTAGMMILIFVWLDRRPILAGILIGLLVIKPQLGLFFPVILIASGRWRVFSAAALTAVAVMLATALVFGPKVFVDYVATGLPNQNLVLIEPYRLGAPLMPTIFMNMRWLGANYATAMAIQLCFTAFAAVALFWAYRWRRDADAWWLASLFFAASVFGSPYLMGYDLLPLTFAALLLRAGGALDAQGRRIAVLVYWLPLIQFALGQFYLPGAALIAPAFALYLLMRLKDSFGVSPSPILAPTRP